MHVALEHNLNDTELVKALTGVVVAHDLQEPMAEVLLKSAEPKREPVRERYLQELMRGFVVYGRMLDGDMIRNVMRWLEQDPRPRLFKALARARRVLLSEDDLQELIALIEQHYRAVLQVTPQSTWRIDRATEQRWKRQGLIPPSLNLGRLVNDAFVAGRLSQVLDDGRSLAEMRAMAREFPMTREAELALQAVRQRVGMDLRGGPGYRATSIAGNVILSENARRVQRVIEAYKLRDLKTTPTNRELFTPEELERLGLDSGPTVQGWRGVARELRNRMAGIDRERDWERVAVSATRMTANIGAISAMAEEGVEMLYFDVHTDACDHCKKVYLEADGTPRQFRVSELMATIMETGGANYNRKASKIGDPEQGWLPNALLHPWCGCRPKRVIPGLKPRKRRQTA